MFGVGGAVRGAFLAAYDLLKEVYIFTAAAIGLAVDTGRLATYGWQGAQLDARLLWGLLLFVPISFAGAKMAERMVQRIPQERFPAVVAAFLALVALKLLVLPSEGEPEQSSQEKPSWAEWRQLEALLPKKSVPPGHDRPRRPHSGSGATSQTTPAWTASAANQARRPGKALLCIEASPVRRSHQLPRSNRAAPSEAMMARVGLRFGDGRFVLAQTG